MSWRTAALRPFRRHPTLAVLGGYVLIALAASVHVAFGDRTIGPEQVLDQDPFYGLGTPPRRPYNDPTPIVIDYPRDLVIARSLHTFPPFAWNPWSGTGVPLIAEQGGAFFPLRLAFYVAPGPGTYTFFRLSRLVLAALGAYALCRARGRSRWAAFVGGGLYELSGTLIWMVPFAATSAAFVVPWLLYGVNLLYTERRLRALAVTGASVGLVLLGGHPGVTAAALFAGIAGFAGASAERWWRPRPRARPILTAAGLAAAAAALGASLAACGVLPFLELLAEGQSYKTTVGSEVWQSSAEFSRAALWPAAFAPILLDSLRDSYPFYPLTLNAMFGLGTLILALAAAWRPRADLTMWSLFVLGVVLCFAPPGFSWLKSLPVVRYVLPRYCFPMLAVPFCVWAASGLEVLTGLPGRRRLLAAVSAVCGLAALAALCSPLMDDGLRGTVGRAAGVLVPFYLAVVAALAAGVWLGRRRGSSGTAVLGVAALAELVALATPHLDEPTSMALRRGRSAMALEAANLARSTHTRVAANNLLAGLPQFNLLDRVPDFRMTAALVPRRYFRYITLLNSDFFTFFVPRDMVSPLLEAAAVRYLIADEGRPPGPRVIWIAGRGLFRNDRALPRARLVRQVTVVPDEEAAQDWLREASSTKAHAADTPLGAQAVVEAASAGELGGLTGAGTGAAAGSVDFVTDQPDEVRLAVDTPAPALLVLADTHYPGWVATVDGRRAVIHPTNVLFRGVLVPAGRHDVRFRYRPLSLGLGLVLTALGAVGLGALLVVERRRRRLGVQERERERERSGPEGS